MNLLEKLTKWAIFSVFLALLPLIFNFLRLLTRGNDPTLDAVLVNGELLLVAASISAAAVGELLGSGRGLLLGKFIAGGGAIIVLCLASLYFADVAASKAVADVVASKATQTLDAAVIADVSQVFFLFAILAGGGCVAMSEV